MQGGGGGSLDIIVCKEGVFTVSVKLIILSLTSDGLQKILEATTRTGTILSSI